jgi:4-amino-4-deoxy-L-arabinose transferase-like glycosyltransferase
MTLALLAFYQGYLTGDRRYFLLMCVPMGLGMLVKGLLAVALPACAIFLFLLIKQELPKLKEMHLIPGIIIIVLIGLPWYVIEYWIHGKVFLDFALGFLFLSRFQGIVSGHTGPWFYYFLALLLGFAPWSHFIPLGLWKAFKNWKNDPELLCLCFIIPAFLVFSIARTKIPNYILPVYPFLAILVGRLWYEFLGEPENKFSAPTKSKARINSRFANTGTANSFAGFAVSNLFFAVVIILIFIGVIYIGSAQYPAEYASLIPPLQALAAALVIGSALSIIFFFFKAYQLSFTAIPAMVFVIAFILTVWALPLVENFKGAKPLGQELAKIIKPNEIIAAYEVGNRPSVVLHSPKPVKFLDKEAQLFSFLKKKNGYAFTTVDEYEKIKSRLPRQAEIFDKKGDLLVLY